MARRRLRDDGSDWLVPHVVADSRRDDTSLLDVIDNVLNHGVVLHGELILGVANVDLIYAKLSVLLAALDKTGLMVSHGESRLPPVAGGRRRRSRSRRTA